MGRETSIKAKKGGYMTRQQVLDSGYMFISISEFMEDYHSGVTRMGITFACTTGKINYTLAGDYPLIVLTPKTLLFEFSKRSK